VGKEVHLLPERKESVEVQERLTQIEKQVEHIQEQMQQLAKRNQNLQEDMKFFELMLIEEYHLLIQLLGNESHQLRVHSVSSDDMKVE
jgi:predicted nuclease with TOPRIM domain